MAISARSVDQPRRILAGPAFEFLRDTVRQAIDLATRVRAAATFQERESAEQTAGQVLR